jgi:hypothetical protein
VDAILDLARASATQELNVIMCMEKTDKVRDYGKGTYTALLQQYDHMAILRRQLMPYCGMTNETRSQLRYDSLAYFGIHCSPYANQTPTRVYDAAFALDLTARLLAALKERGLDK